MEYPIPNPSGNKILSLVNELYQRSTGMCRAGAGPYGIGVSVVEDTPIDVFFTFDPDPVLDCKILPEEIPEYTVGVIGSWSGERKYLSREEVGQLLSASDPKTRILAEMLRYFEGKTWIVSCADCQEAFGILADAEMREAFGLDEQEQIGPKLGDGFYGLLGNHRTGVRQWTGCG